MRQSFYAVLGLALVGCGSEPPAFVEKPVFSLDFAVERTETGEVVQEPLPADTDVDAILADLEGSSGDATADDGAADDPATSGDGDGTGSQNPSAPGAGGLEPGDSDEWVTPDLSRPNSGEMKACARIAGVPESRLRIAGDQKSVTVSAADVLVAKVTGNQNRLALNFRGEAGAPLAGICLFLAGNQAEVELKSNLTIARVLYTARGNQSSGSIVAEDGGDVEGMVVDLGGNQASLSVAGASTCPSPRLKGQGTTFNCTPR